MKVRERTNMRRIIAIAVFAALAVSGFACKPKPGAGPAGQAAPPINPPPKDVAAMAALFPGKPLVFLYAPDLASLLSKARESGPTKNYLESRGMERFKESRLFLKLEVRMNELAGLIGQDLKPGDLMPLAGGRSGFGLYDIGELRFIYVTKISAEKLAATALWAARDQAQELEVQGSPCYMIVSGEGGSAVYFGMAGDYLVVSNMEDGFKDAFARAQGDGAEAGSLLNDPGFKTAFPARISVHDLLMFLDQAALAENPYFRRYWIYRNQGDISWIETALVDLELTGETWTESRYYVSRSIPDSLTNRDLSPCLDLVGQGMFGECLSADEDQARELILSLFPAEPGLKAASDPAREQGSSSSGPGDQLTQSLAPSRPQVIGTVSLVAWSEDRFFFRLGRSVVIQMEKPRGLDLEELREALALEWSARVFQGGGRELPWSEDQYGTVLAPPLFSGEAVWMDKEGRFLVVSGDGAMHKKMLDSIRSAAGKKAAPGRGFTGVYRSSWDAVRAREDFRRIADLLSRYDSWPRSESEAALTQDLASLLGSLSAETLRREAVRDQSMIREVITAGPAPSK